jgi:hypothetical protein
MTCPASSSVDIVATIAAASSYSARVGPHGSGSGDGGADGGGAGLGMELRVAVKVLSGIVGWVSVAPPGEHAASAKPAAMIEVDVRIPGSVSLAGQQLDPACPVLWP